MQPMSKRDRFLMLLGVTPHALSNLEQTIAGKAEVATRKVKVRKGLRTKKEWMQKPEMVRRSEEAYASSPEAIERERKAREKLARGDLEVPPGKTVTRVANPGMTAKLTKKVTLHASYSKQAGLGGASFDAEAGTPVAVHATDTLGVMFIEVFNVEYDPEDKKKKNPKLKPAGKGGYTQTIDVKGSQEFVRTDEPLFPDEPKLSDIKQGAIGDCYLMAGLGSIVDKDPGVIKRAIRDNGDGTVTVRLFDKTTDDPPQFVEKFIAFEKSILKSKEGDHAKDTLWVQMLEKAYAIHARNAKSGAEGGSYLGIGGGGDTNDVFEAFLGRPGKNDSLPSNKQLVANLFSAPNLAKLAPAKQFTDQDLDNFKNDILALQTDGSPNLDQGALDTLLSAVRGKTADRDSTNFPANNITAAFNQSGVIKALKASGIDPEAVMRCARQRASVPPDFPAVEEFLTSAAQVLANPSPTGEDLARLMKSDKFQALPKNLQDTFRKDVEAAFPGPQGSGIYTQTQDELFDKIQNIIDNEGCVSMSTRREVGEKITGSGMSAGEPMSEGLVGEHAYSITGTYVPKQGEDLYVPGQRPVKYVRVRNPWGDGKKGGLIRSGDQNGRKYIIVTDPKTGEFIKMIASPTHEGEFYLELSDLTRRCSTVHATEPLVSPESKLRSEVKKMVQGTWVDSDEVYKEALSILYEEGEQQALARVQRYVDEVKEEQQKVRDYIAKKTAGTTLDPQQVYQKAEVWLYLDGLDQTLIRLDHYFDQELS